MHVEGGHQTGGAVTDVFELLAGRPPRCRRPGRVLAAAGLDGGLLIDRQHQRVEGLGQVQAAHVGDLFPELGVVAAGQPGADLVGLDVQVGEDPPDLRRRDPHRRHIPGQQVMAPMAHMRRRRRRCPSHDLDPLVMAIHPRATRPGPVIQTRQTVGLEPTPPHPHVLLAHPHLGRDPTARHSLGRHQHHPAAAHHPLGRRVRTHPTLQLQPLLDADLQRRHAPHRRPSLGSKVGPANHTRVTSAGMH
jgi:hypothetical protein